MLQHSKTSVVFRNNELNELGFHAV